MTCEAIASSQGIPFRFLKSVVGELRRAGLVRSQRAAAKAGTGWAAAPTRSPCSTSAVPSTGTC
ncbi:hypothetical protein [Streptomyces sp. KL116D]|uniref:hypothetical protein n=1 Tax=Streptomyces sp. KL116D TaxID=3045152 RepID=UPI003555F780